MALRFSDEAVNLSDIGFLVADPSELYRDIFRQLLYGFGARSVLEASNSAAARRLMAQENIDFLICAADLPGAGGGIGLVRSVRLDREHRLRSIPMMITMGTARRISVGEARDSGANFVLTKPVSPVVLYDRINWIARHPRPYWDSPDYYGPDRRFHILDDGVGVPRRRMKDGSASEQDKNNVA